MELSHLIRDCRDMSRQYRFCIEMQSKIDRSLESFLAGFFPRESSKEKAYAKAKAWRLAVEKGRAPDQCLNDTQQECERGAALAEEMIRQAAVSRGPADKLRASLEKQMAELARLLPVWEWWSNIKGAGAIGLVQIIGSAGDISNYATVSRLWKRMGLAVVEGQRQRRLRDKDLATIHAYSPARRSLMWSIGDSLFRHQWSKAPKGPYGAVYGARREYTAAANRDWTKQHAMDDAKRVMTKALLRDLWIEWHRVVPKPT